MMVFYTSRIKGFTLLSVMLTMSVIASIAFLLNRDNGMNIKIVSSQSDINHAYYAAEAGLQAVNSKIQTASCGGSHPTVSSPVTNNDLGGASYSAYATASTGDVVNLVSVGTYNGTSVTLKHDSAYVYEVGTKSYTLDNASDTMIAQGSNNNYGASDEIEIENEGTYFQRLLFKFDLSVFPAGSWPIQSTFTAYSPNFSGSAPVALNRVTSSWTETGVNWFTRDGATPWLTQGGDYHPTPIAEVEFSNFLGGQYHAFDTTAATIAWMSGDYPNYGFIMRLVNGLLVPGQDYDYAASDNATAAYWPTLAIQYLQPCGTTGPGA